MLVKNLIASMSNIFTFLTFSDPFIFMFSTCRPLPRYCLQGHVVGVEDTECEEGHAVTTRGDDSGSGVFGQMLSAIRLCFFLFWGTLHGICLDYFVDVRLIALLAIDNKYFISWLLFFPLINRNLPTLSRYL